MDFATTFLEATVRTATPLALAALGETLCERTGVINVGLEGAIMAGCFGAVAGGLAGGVLGGVAGGLAAGLLVGILLGAMVIGLRADQIITGTALTMAAYGATGAVHRMAFGTGGVALSVPSLPPLPIPGFSSVPVIGQALFSQPPLAYVALLLVPGTWWLLYRTHTGLSMRATGEYPPAAEASGVVVDRLRWLGIIASSGAGGLAGATLTFQAGTFSEQMSAGRGFIAIAIVALGRWTPQGAIAAALLFGAASALQYQFQASGSELPYQLFLALPYVVTLVALATGAGRARAPAALGRLE